MVVGEYTGKIADHIVGLGFSGTPEEVVKHSKLVILDTISAVLATSNPSYPASTIIRDRVIEQVPEGVYRREMFLVLGEDGEQHKADHYRIVKAERPIKPSKKYVGYVLEGMREHDIDADYMRKFQDLYDSL